MESDAVEKDVPLGNDDENKILRRVKKKVREYVLDHPTMLPDTPAKWGQILRNSIANLELPKLSKEEKAELLSYACNVHKDPKVASKLPGLREELYPKLEEVAQPPPQAYQRAMRYIETVLNDKTLQWPSEPDPKKWQRVLENSIMRKVPFTYPEDCLPNLANGICEWIHNGRPNVSEESKEADKNPIIRLQKPPIATNPLASYHQNQAASPFQHSYSQQPHNQSPFPNNSRMDLSSHLTGSPSTISPSSALFPPNVPDLHQVPVSRYSQPRLPQRPQPNFKHMNGDANGSRPNHAHHDVQEEEKKLDEEDEPPIEFPPESLEKIVMRCHKCSNQIASASQLQFDLMNDTIVVLTSTCEEIWSKFHHSPNNKKIKCRKCSHTIGKQMQNDEQGEHLTLPLFKPNRIHFEVNEMRFDLTMFLPIKLLDEDVAKGLWYYWKRFLPKAEETWTCSVCTLVNEPSCAVCGACDRPKLVDTSKWTPKEVFVFVYSLATVLEDAPDLELLETYPNGRKFGQMTDLELEEVLGIHSQAMREKILERVIPLEKEILIKPEPVPQIQEAPQIRAPQIRAPPESFRNTWQCYKCTYNNEQGSDSCKMCNSAPRKLHQVDNEEWRLNLTYNVSVDVQTPRGHGWIPGVITNVERDFIYVTYECYMTSEWLSIESRRLAPYSSFRSCYLVPPNIEDMERSSYAHLARSGAVQQNALYAELLYPGRYSSGKRDSGCFSQHLDSEGMIQPATSPQVEEIKEAPSRYYVRDRNSKEALLEDIDEYFAPRRHQDPENMDQYYIDATLIVKPHGQRKQEYRLLEVKKNKKYPHLLEFGPENEQKEVKLDFQDYIMEDQDGVKVEFVVSGQSDDGLTGDVMHIPKEFKTDVSWDDLKEDVDTTVHLFALHYIPNDKDGPGKAQRRYGIAIPNDMEDLPEFDVFLRTKTYLEATQAFDARLVLERLGQHDLAKEKMITLKRCHMRLFDIMMNTRYDPEYKVDAHRIRFLLVPISDDGFDWDTIEHVSNFPLKKLLNVYIRELNGGKREPFDLSDIMFSSFVNLKRQFFVAERPDYELSLDSPRKGDQTYRNFHAKKYRKEFEDEDQPIVLCHEWRPRAANVLHKIAEQKIAVPDPDYLVPESMKVLPVTPELMFHLQDIPCSMWGIECWLVAKEFHRWISPSIELPFESIKTALTASSFDSEVGQNYECLEFYGDGVLKYMAVEYVWLKYPDKTEGEMQPMKSIEISNRKLYRLAKQMELSQYMLVNSYHKKYYKVPGYLFKDDFSPLETRDIHYKRVADVVEALLGVAFEHLGFDGAYQLLEWVNHGIKKLPYEHPPEDRAYKELLRSHEVASNISTLEKILNYKFKHKIYPIVALHLKSTKRDLLRQSERLEFLGDAVLDVLVTRFIYAKRTKENQEDLTDWRSDIVCNDTLATISYEHKLPDLFIDVHDSTREVIQEFYDKRSHDINNPRPLIRRNRPADPYKYNKSMSDIVECLFGAVYLDSDRDVEKVWEVFQSWLYLEV